MNGSGPEDMSQAFTSRGEALLSLLRASGGAMKLPPRARYDLAELLAAEGRLDDFAETFRQAFLHMPMQRPALDDSPDIPLNARALTLRDRATALIERGIRYAPILAALALSEAILGNDDTVRRLIDYDRFFRSGPIARRDDFGSPDYHAVLAEEIRSNLIFVTDQSRTPLRGGWRHNRLLETQMPACRALKREIRAAVGRYIGSLPEDSNHPFIASTPRDFILDSWAVVAGGDTHIEPHIHFRAWLSGVYYVSSGQAEKERGWLCVGPPAQLDRSTCWEKRFVPPEPGNLVLMPGYFSHATTPSESCHERICVAFNVMPRELA